MKQLKFLAPVAAFAFLALLIGCKPGAVGGTWAATTDCKSCHSAESTSTYGALVLANKGQYGASGHFNGPRVMMPGSSVVYEFEGSNAMYNNGASCSQCHTSQGFVSYVNTGVAGNQEPASQPGCFTCHKPHESGDFSLRTVSPVALVDGVTTFDKGKGNLCVTCHHARTKSASGITATDNSTVAGFAALISGSPYSIAATTTAPKILQKWSSSSGPHHGPQSDFLMGVNNWIYTKTVVTYQGQSEHYGAAPDSCVACHMWDPATGNLSGTMSMGGHGWYLTDTVHGTPKDLVAACQNCHQVSPAVGTASSWPAALTASTFANSGHVAGAVIVGDPANADIIYEIDHMKKALLTYFGDSTNFLAITYTLDGAKNYTGYSIAAATTGQAPVTIPAGGADYVLGSTWEWHKDWEFNAYSAVAVDAGVTSILAYPAMNKWQSQSFWNFKFFMEDKSRGVHNPKYAAQILYDAIQNLLDKGVNASQLGGITLGPRPT